jgi:hypothetical protein
MSNQNINIYQVKEVLKANGDQPLIFSFEGQNIHPGYHVTEVKHASVNSLDCGSGKEQWEEIIIQLMDGSALFKGEHMSCDKFLGIAGKAIESLSFDENTLTFIEFAPNNKGLRKLAIETVEASEGQVIVTLTSPTAMCKPYQRALAKQLPNADKESCCESDKPKPTAATCCA